MYEANSIVYAIGRTEILRGVDFHARPGEITVIVGPNGSGKSTLLKALSGEIKTEGTIRLNNRAIETLRPWEAATMRAVLPQSSVLTFPFSVREVVKLGLSGGTPGLTSEQLERLPERALGRVDLAGFSGRAYNGISGGEQQRVQLARVLCQIWKPLLNGEPRYLLLDEPISSLDIRHQLLIMDIARDYASAGGGVVAILHDLNLAAMYADTIAVMSRGRIVAQGEPKDALTDSVIEEVFDCPLRLNAVPAKDIQFVLPQTARRPSRLHTQR